MIDFAKDDMVPELKRLWHYGFPEDTEYCDFYFDHYFSCSDCIVVSGENGIETATYLFRGECDIGGKLYSTVYWYGGATWGEYRRRGNLSRSLDFLQKYCIDNGIAIISVRPVEETLSIYDRRGFIPGILLQCTTAQISEICDTVQVQPCAFESLAGMRAGYLGDHCINWNEKTMRYMYLDLCLDGGVVSMDIGGLQYYAAYTLYKDELLLRETNCPVQNLRILLHSLCRYVGYTGKVTIYSKCGEEPAFDEITESKTKYYAHIWVSPKSGIHRTDTGWYINLTAD